MDDTTRSTTIRQQVIQTVADAEGTTPLELRPLEDVIDTDALEAIFTPSSDIKKKTLLFEYEGYTVKVTHDRVVALEIPSASD